MKMLRAVFTLPLLACSGLADAAVPDWLAGCWESPDKANMEVWVTATDGSLIGFAASVNHGEIGFYELLHINTSEDGAWTLTAHPSGQTRASFTATHITDNSITFANPAHDYPQQISYRREGDLLFATTATMDGDKVQSFDKRRCE